MNPFRVLRRHRDFRIFWTGQTLSLVGSWMQTMAVGWLSLQLSNSAFVVGLVASAGALPIVLLSMHAGAIVDRGDRFRYIRGTQAAFLILAVTLWLVTVSGHVSVPWLLGLMLLQGVASAIEIPARQAFIIQLVGREDLQPAIALNSSGFNLARILGPAIGGLVIGRLGIAWCFALNAVSFVAVLWGLAHIRTGRAVADVKSPLSPPWRVLLASSTAGAMDGLRHLARPGPVRELLILVTVGALFGGPFLTLMPVVARDRLGLGAGGYGTLLASVGVGGFIGALLVAGPLAQRARKGAALISAALLFPATLIVFAVTTNIVAAHLLLFAIGIAMIIFNALSNGVLQLLVDDAYRGRLMAFYSLVFIGISQAFGSFALGAAARWFGSAAAIGTSAGILFVASCYAWQRRDFWKHV
jgi:MFS family permease